MGRASGRILDLSSALDADPSLLDHAKLPALAARCHADLVIASGHASAGAPAHQPTAVSTIGTSARYSARRPSTSLRLPDATLSTWGMVDWTHLPAGQR